MSTLPNPDERFRIERTWWTPSEHGLGTRARPTHIDAHVPAPIADLDIEIPASMFGDVVAAQHALEELSDDDVRHQLEGAARQLMRSEAIASSRIEQHLIGHRALARAASPLTGEPHGEAAVVLGNLRSIDKAAARADSFDAHALLDLHRALFEQTGQAHIAGRLRTTQNWIGGRSDSPARAAFVPPPPQYVDALLGDLMAFVARDDMPPIIQAAVAHAQFETIHPFDDGNGRVGRALIHVILVRRGAVPDVTLPISLVLLARGERYVRGLTNWRGPDRADWLSFFIGVVHEAAMCATRLGSAIEALVDRWLEQAGMPRADSATRALLLALPSLPILDVETAATHLHTSSESARRAVNQLEQAGVLKQRGQGRSRGRIWECVGLYRVLDEFERDLLDGAGPGAGPTAP